MVRPDGQQLAAAHACGQGETDDWSDMGVATGTSRIEEAVQLSGPQTAFPPIVGAWQAQLLEGGFL